MTRRWLVTGSAGLLGAQVVDALHRLRPGDEVTGVGHVDVDLRDSRAVHDAVAGHSVVVNCAAWTDVDGAQTTPAGVRSAMAVNAAGAGHVAVACRAAAARLLHLSTDYVFDGAADTPYPEDAPTRPASVYGASKLAGEWAVLAGGGHVVRTAWLHDGEHGRSFVATMAARARAREPSAVVADQTGQPTWVRPLAERLVALGAADTQLPGVMHATCRGQTSWHELASEVYGILGADPDLVSPTSSAALAQTRPAPRPTYAVLADTRTAALGIEPMPTWLDGLKTALGGQPL